MNFARFSAGPGNYKWRTCRRRDAYMHEQVRRSERPKLNTYMNFMPVGNNDTLIPFELKCVKMAQSVGCKYKTIKIVLTESEARKSSNWRIRCGPRVCSPCIVYRVREHRFGWNFTALWVLKVEDTCETNPKRNKNTVKVYYPLKNLDFCPVLFYFHRHPSWFIHGTNDRICHSRSVVNHSYPNQVDW